MRKRWPVGAVLLMGLLVALLWGLTSSPRDPEPASGRKDTSASWMPSTPGARPLLVAALTGQTPDAASIRGTVRNARGPVAGAKILASLSVAGESLSERPCVPHFQPQEEDAAPSPCDTTQWVRIDQLVARRDGEILVVAETLSQEDGSFLLTGLEEGSYTLWAESPEGVGLRENVALGEAVDLVLGQGSRLSGRVFGEGGPVPGALVTAIFTRQSRFFETVTDARGDYRLGPLPRGSYVLLASHAGITSTPVPLPWLYLPEVSQNLGISMPKSLLGRVVSAEGKPVAGAEVQLSQEEGRTVRTDAAGRFVFERLSLPGYTVIARHEDRMTLERVDLFKAKSHAVEVTLSLKAFIAEVAGVVHDARGQPVVGALVHCNVGPERQAIAFKTRTDAKGRYHLGPLPAGTGSFFVFNPDQHLPHAETKVLAQGPQTLDFTLTSKTVIDATLVDGRGQPIGNQPLFVYELGTWGCIAEERSGRDGRVSIGVPKPGTYLVSTRKGESDKRSSRAQIVRVTAPARDVRIVLGDSPWVEGRLLDEEGQPVQHAPVKLWAEDDLAQDKGWAATRTDAQGRFKLMAQEPGTYRVVAEIGDTASSRLASLKVELGQGGVQVTLRFESDHPLSGVVVDRRGMPLLGALVTFQSQRRVQEISNERAIVTTDARGRFHFPAVSGTWAALSVSLQDHHVDGVRTGEPLDVFRLEPSAREVRVVMARTAQVRGRFTRADGSPISRFTVNGERRDNPGGYVQWPIVREGPLTLELAESVEGASVARRTVSVQLEVDLDVGIIIAGG